MAIPVWLPFALDAGSMVSSGIGNYLEGKNQESYSKRVMQMQKQASARRQKAEAAAGAANLWFGLAGRQQMQPLYQKMPDIDPYESSGVGSLFKGLGTGLSFASTALGVYDKGQRVLMQRAEEAGAKEALAASVRAVADARPAVTTVSDVPSAMFYDNLTQYTGGEAGLIDQSLAVGTKPISDAVSHHTQVLDNLTSAAADTSNIPEYSGIWKRSEDEAFLRSRDATLAKLAMEERGKLAKAREVEILRNMQQSNSDRDYRYKVNLFEWQKNQANLTREYNEKADNRTLMAALTKARLSHDEVHRARYDGTPDVEKLSKFKEIIGLFQDVPGISITTDKTGKPLVTVDDTMELEGPRLHSLIRMFFRLSSDEAIMQGDMDVFNDISEGIGGQFLVKWNNFVGDGILNIGGKDVNLAQFENDIRRYVTDGTLANMLNTITTMDYNTKIRLNSEIARNVAYSASGLAKMHKGFTNLGFVDEGHYTAYYIKELGELYGIVESPVLKTSGEGTILDKAGKAAGIVIEGPEDKVITPAGKLVLNPLEHHATVASSTKVALPQREIPGVDVEAIATNFLLSSPDVDPVRDKFIDSAMEESNTYRNTENNLLFGLSAGIQAYQRSLADSNYKWGRSVSAPSLRDPNLITDYMAPGSRVQNAVEGQAGLANFFGLGGLYTDTRNLDATASQPYHGFVANDPRIGTQTLAEKYAQKRPWLGSATLNAARQFQRGGQPIRSISTARR